MSTLQEIARDILKVELEENTSKRRVSRKLQARIDEVEDENLLKQIERKMNMPPLEELDSDDDGGDLQQNGAKSAEVERKLDAGNLLAEFLSASAVASERSAFQMELKMKGAIGEVGQRDKLSYISLFKTNRRGPRERL